MEEIRKVFELTASKYGGDKANKTYRLPRNMEEIRLVATEPSLEIWRR
jgi:hypothetical protein